MPAPPVLIVWFEEPGESAHLCSSVMIIITRKRLHPDSIRDSIQIRIVAADSIRGSIQKKISDSQVPIIVFILPFWTRLRQFVQHGHECSSVVFILMPVGMVKVDWQHIHALLHALHHRLRIRDHGF